MGYGWLWIVWLEMAVVASVDSWNCFVLKDESIRRSQNLVTLLLFQNLDLSRD
jgi:uncharacterized membrane protein